MASKEATGENPAHSIFSSSFPVYLPPCEALFLPDAEFQAYIKTLFASPNIKKPSGDDDAPPETAEYARIKQEVSEAMDMESTSTTSELNEPANHGDKTPSAKPAPFINALLQNATRHYTETKLTAENKMLTENADVAYRSTTSGLVDLFDELEEVVSAARLTELLDAAWKEDALATLKIIFNARSIHLGKSSRFAFYRSFAWLAQNHPLTLLANLQWLTRPVIEKVKKDRAKGPEWVKKEGQDDEDDDMVMVEASDDEKKDDTIPARPGKEHDVKFGVSHGYWKDLLNIVALAANDQLTIEGISNNQGFILRKKPVGVNKGREFDPEAAKKLRRKKKSEQHERVMQKFENDAFYRSLHLTVARLFASQLQEDRNLLSSENKSDLKRLSLAAKWAPTFGEFHDKHTFITSSIAEILYPQASEICPDVSSDNRELYLRHAREAYRRLTVSPLRKALAVVERDIAAQNFENIKYDRVPSLAMNRYTKLFIEKDFRHFSKYIELVSTGTARISGATLLPSTLVAKVPTIRPRGIRPKDLIAAKVLDGQWKTLVQRVRDSGTLQSSIAVCDVSGSMLEPRFADGTCPMDSAIGLSLLLAEIVEEPFGGAFITFSERPTVVQVGGAKDGRSFSEKVTSIKSAEWGTNTNFVAVFENLILPLAVEHNLKQEDMVKQVFVFSDMQFDTANDGTERWTTAFERVKKRFADAGYEMPKLVFWNLAGGRAGYGGYCTERGGDDTAPKPVTAEETGTALVSGYSQGQMKMFLENGQFGDGEDEDEEVVDEDMVNEGGDGDGMVEVRKAKKVKMDPLAIVKKAISHKAYSMLEVVD
ncbi:hypothetical protein K432DRAFT_381623 [Lepidopterella palustris CBS 459.81]|uniref:DUF2828 domain-containing protein n=1 Tax=Lepidopterella palustris CBS 459.81 TaxID=1314670 RepID=A0A8E2EC51_9PEZI|nr:hypothetical protein K432DRAFT_381623 [Lepidopterella palustris CBS 459.81]